MIARRLLAVSLTVAALALSVGPTPAHAAARGGCVTRAEYRAVHLGMTARQVTRLWHGRGQVAESGRTYRACGGGHVNVDLHGHPRRVVAKYRVHHRDPLAP